MMDENCDLAKICRFCLKQRSNMKNLFNISLSDADSETKIPNFVQKMVSIMISKCDGLPENMCKRCINELTNAYKFAQQCATSDKELRLHKHNVQSKTAMNKKQHSTDVETIHLNPTNIDSKENITSEVGDNSNSDNRNCLRCNLSFNSLKEYLSHQNRHNSACKGLKSHKNNKSKRKAKYCCSECGRSFKFEHFLKIHSYTHLDKKPYICPHCSKGCCTAENLKRHMKIHDENNVKKVHACKICNKEFPYPSILAEHVKTHTGERPFLCSMCGKGFRQNGALRYHMRSHTGVKPYSCIYCNQHFTSQSILRVHIRKHTNERPYICDICGVAFRQSTDLRSHYRTHTGDKPVLCPICGKRMSKTGQLTVHLRTHTGEKPYSCTTCGKAFTTRRVLVVHERIHTGERPHVCTVCGKGFSQSGSLKTHLKTHNKGKINSAIFKSNTEDSESKLITDKNCISIKIESSSNVDTALNADDQSCLLEEKPSILMIKKE